MIEIINSQKLEKSLQIFLSLLVVAVFDFLLSEIVSLQSQVEESFVFLGQLEKKFSHSFIVSVLSVEKLENFTNQIEKRNLILLIFLLNLKLYFLIVEKLLKRLDNQRLEHRILFFLSLQKFEQES